MTILDHRSAREKSPRVRSWLAASVALTCLWSLPAVADQGITSPVHKKNIGRIVWSSKVIERGKEHEAAFATHFTVAGPIFGRLYLDKPLESYPVVFDGKEQTSGTNIYEEHYFVDNVLKENRFDNLEDDEARDWTTLRIDLHPMTEHADPKVANAWLRVIKDLSPGDHVIRVEVWNGTGKVQGPKPIAVGEFTLTVVAGEAASTGRSAPGDSYTGSDREQLKAKVLSELAARDVGKAKDALRVSITSGWEESRYEDTKGRFRMIKATVLWRDLEHTGACAYNSYNFAENASGSGWGALHFQGFSQSPDGTADCK